MKNTGLKNKIYLFFIVWLIVTAVFSSCGNLNSNLTTISINTNLDTSRGKDEVKSFKLTISAADFDTITKSFTGESISLAVSSGKNRLFTLEALDSEGYSIYKDSQEVDLILEKKVEISFFMKAFEAAIIGCDVDFYGSTFFWESTASGAKYQLKYSKKEDELKNAKIFDCETNHYTISELDKGTYYWKCRSIVDNKKSSWSETYKLTKRNIKGGNITLTNATDLYYLSKSIDLWNKSFELDNNIDMSKLDQKFKFTPIGKTTNKTTDEVFTGNFNGNNNTISNLIIYHSGYSQGFFGTVKSSTIKNLTLEKVTLKNSKNDQYVGGLAGVVDYSTTNSTDNPQINNCHIINSTISSDAQVVGGLIGLIKGATSTTNNVDNQNLSSIVGSQEDEESDNTKNYSLTDCTSSATVISNFEGPKEGYAGGLIGSAIDSNIKNCKNSGSVTAKYQNTLTGGIAGLLRNSTIEESANTGEINGDYAGGIVGKADRFFIDKCYNEAEITGKSSAGGLAGGFYYDQEGTKYAKNTNKATNCYNTGNIYGSTYTGGLVGFIDDIKDATTQYTIATCYSAAKEISGGEKVTGAFIGNIKNNTVKVTNCYYKVEENSDIEAIGSETVNNNIKLNKIENTSSYEDWDWDFDTIWQTDGNEGYPKLQWSQTASQ